MMNILERIDELRKARGWSVNNLAMEAMLTQSTVNNLYARKSEPKLSTLRAICGAFGITLSEFFAEEDGEDGTCAELHRHIDRMTPARREALLTFLDSML